MGKKIMSIRLGIAALRMLPHIAFYLNNTQYFDKDLEKYSPLGGGGNTLCFRYGLSMCLPQPILLQIGKTQKLVY